jgi:O-antigen/teichoic acid export membrane protein
MKDAVKANIDKQKESLSKYIRRIGGLLAFVVAAIAACYAWFAEMLLPCYEDAVHLKATLTLLAVCIAIILTLCVVSYEVGLREGRCREQADHGEVEHRIAEALSKVKEKTGA